MSIYSFALPSGLDAPIPQSGSGSGYLDVMLDPISLDYIPSDDGGIVETADRRTMVLCMFSIEFGRCYSSPPDGTRILQLLREGLLTTGQVAAEYTRAARVLEAAGEIANYKITVDDARGQPLRDETGRFAPLHRWIDLSSRSPVDAVFGPEGA